MRLYHHPYSFNARRAVMTALHLRAPVELAFVDLQKGEQRQPQFLALNPNHRVPVLEDDGFILWESHAIMQYLADKTPRQTQSRHVRVPTSTAGSSGAANTSRRRSAF